MGHGVWFAAAVVGAALATAGCGTAATATDTVGVSVPAQRHPRPATVEPTDGRLGDATTVRAGSRLRELSPGGRPDVRPRGDAPRRDGVGAGAACASRELTPAPDTLGAMHEATLCLLNGERADRGLAPLRPNDKLAGAATAYAQDLVAGSYFSHTGRDGSGLFERIERSGYLPRDAGWALGENLAWGTGGLATPAAIMQAWMNSPGHRENILNGGYREIGVGIVTGNPAQPDGLGATYATEFGVIEGVEARRAGRRARQARKRARRQVRARNARSVRKSRGSKAHDRRAKALGPKARIAI